MDRNELIPYAGREQAWVKHFLLESYLARVIMITARSKYLRIGSSGPVLPARQNIGSESGCGQPGGLLAECYRVTHMAETYSLQCRASRCQGIHCQS